MKKINITFPQFIIASIVLLSISLFSCVKLINLVSENIVNIQENEVIIEEIVENKTEESQTEEVSVEEREKTIDELVAEVEQGLAGDGDQRRKYLGDKYDEVMNIINERYKTAKVSSTTSRSSTTEVTGSKAEYQNYAHTRVLEYGWSEYDYECLVKLWNKESNWNPLAHNSSSGAHGIPQSLPASKMAAYGDDYYTNGKTQIEWGLNYIKNRYGNPSSAWSFWLSHNWY